MARSLGFSGNGINFQIVFGQSFWLKCLSWWCTHCSARMDASERTSGMWSDTVVSPFDLSWTLLVGGGLLVPFPLLGPPVVKQLIPIVTVVPGQGGQFQCASPNKWTVSMMSLFYLVFFLCASQIYSVYFQLKKKFFLAMPCSMQDLSFPTKNWALAQCNESAES